MLAQRVKRLGQRIYFGCVMKVNNTIDFLWSCTEATRQFGRSVVGFLVADVGFSSDYLAGCGLTAAYLSA